MATSPELPRVSTLAELLDLEELDRDLYRAHNPRRPFTAHLYGGQVAAQALRAAGMTVPEGRFAHSLHGYYLRSGEADHPTIMRVTRDRDGRSFSARHVVALQHGEAIFTASASFHVDEESGDFSGVPFPDGIPAPESLTEEGGNEDVMFRMRPVLDGSHGPDDMRVSRRIWGRTREPLPDDREAARVRARLLLGHEHGLHRARRPWAPARRHQPRPHHLLPPSDARRRLVVHGARAGVGGRRAVACTAGRSTTGPDGWRRRWSRRT